MRAIDSVRFTLRVVASDASAGVPLVTGLLTWAVAAALGWGAGGQSLNPGYADPFNYLLTTAAFLGPMAAGAAALAVGNVVRSGVADLADSASRGRHRAFRVSLSAVVLWQLVAMATMLVMLWVRLRPGGARDAADFSLIGLWVAIAVACSAVGAAVGSLTTSYFAPPTTALVVFAWIYGFSFASGKEQRLSPVYPDVFYRVWYQPHLALVATQVIGLVALSMVAYTFLVKPQLRLVVAGLAVTTFAAATLFWTELSPDPVEYRTVPEHIPCRMQEGVSLCMWPESLPQAPEALRALATVVSSVEPLYSAPQRFSETGLPEHATGEYQMPAPADGDYVFRAVLSVVPPISCPSQSALDSQYALTSLVSAKVSGRSDNSQIAAVLKEPMSLQRRWVENRIRILSRACP